MKVIEDLVDEELFVDIILLDDDFERLEDDQVLTKRLLVKKNPVYIGIRKLAKGEFYDEEES